MSKSDKLFKDLGYECEVKPIINGGSFDFGYYHNYIHTHYSECDGCTTEYIKEISFLNHIKKPENNAIMVQSKYKCDYYDNYEYDRYVHLDVNEIQAIYEKAKELGWNE